MKKKGIIEIIAAVLILLFIYVSLTKFINNKTFRFELSLSPNIKSLVAWLTWGIPSIELLIAVMFLVKKMRMAAFYMSAILFAAYIIAMLRFHFYVPNIRGGILNNLSFTQYLAVNSALLILSITGGILLIYVKRSSSNSQKEEDVILT